MDFNPSDVFIKIKKLEFKFLLLPLLLIIGNFVMVYFYHYTKLKYLSIPLLIIYFLIKLIFRIDRISVEFNEKSIKSPITGVVIKTDENSITIKKGLFDKADFRKTFAHTKIIKGKIFIFGDNENQSMLVGVAPGAAVCKIILPKGFLINVKEGEKVISGVTDIGISNEKN